MVEIVIDRQRTEVHRAIVQFVAQRSYRLTNPWWVEGLRIETPRLDGWRLPTEGSATQFDRHIPAPRRKTWWATMLDIPQVARIELEVKRRRGRTVIKVKISDHADSTKLAAELQAHLLDDRAYNASGLSACQACGAPVANVVARYCGRCGRQLVTTKANDTSLPSVAAQPEQPPIVTAPERASPIAEATPRASSSIAVDAPSQSLAEPLAADDEMKPEQDSLDANEPGAEAPAASGAVAENETPRDDGPICEAVAEADDEAEEPPRRALAEEEE